MQVRVMRGRRGVVVLLTAALLLVTVVVARLGTYAPSASGELSAAEPEDTCADVYVLGVDGNAERPAAGSGLTFGRTVEAVVAPYVRAIEPHRVVAFARLSGTMPSLSTLTAGAGKTVRRAALSDWAAPIPDAIARAQSRINSLATACPGQQFVLVGYAQGAAVVHRVLARLGSGVRARVSASVLVSDPLKVAFTRSRIFGDPSAPRKREGQLAKVWTRADVPAPPPGGRFWTVCTAHDLVCDPTDGSVSDAARTARSYGKSMLAPVVADIADRTELWPTPIPRTRVATLGEGAAASLQLTVDVAPGRGVVFALLTALPAGLSLSSSGLISGTPTSPGNAVVSYSVRGANPVTTAHQGVIALTVTPKSAAPDSGGQTTCETRSDGTAWCWGRNDYGQFGSGGTTSSATPTQVVGTGFDSISTSGSATCAIKLDRTLWCWGLNDFGQTGHQASTKPLLVPTQVGAMSTWSQVSVAWSHACALRVSGALYCWGQGLRGQLGTGVTVRSVATPQRVGSAVDWVDVITAGWHTCGVRRDGTAWCWGSNARGELGIGSATRAAEPVELAGTWSGLSASWIGTCGVQTDGSLYCWGANRRGEVGDGSQTDRLTPVAVGTGVRWASVTSSEQSTCALDVDGQTWCWGANTYGQSDPEETGVESLVPRRVPSVPTLTRLTSGWLFFCGSDASGATHCWGSDEAHALGDSGLPSSPSTSSTTVHRPVRNAGVVTGKAARRLDRLTPAQVAVHDLGDRPEVTAQQRAITGALEFKVMTYNVLGSQHTAPGADASEFAPGRLRAEWTSTLLRARHLSLVGAQEIQPNQVEAIAAASSGRYLVVPGNVDGYGPAPQSVLLRQPSWSVTWEGSISIPFMDGWRRQPVLRIQEHATGREIYFLNVHFSPGGRQVQRAKAMDILVAEVKTLAKDGLPMLVTGDFNARDWTFCQITTRTHLRAAQGGSTGTPCRPPAVRRIDWIFGSGGSFSHWTLLKTPEVELTTDHSIQDALFSIM
jgi:endonuclease/exonuclease/phosphatase family metal-dependent hydrolase